VLFRAYDGELLPAACEAEASKQLAVPQRKTCAVSPLAIRKLLLAALCSPSHVPPLFPLFLLAGNLAGLRPTGISADPNEMTGNPHKISAQAVRAVLAELARKSGGHHDPHWKHHYSELNVSAMARTVGGKSQAGAKKHPHQQQLLLEDALASTDDGTLMRFFKASEFKTELLAKRLVRAAGAESAPLCWLCALRRGGR
jgi:hypothetical protein